MRRTALSTVFVALLAACARETTAPGSVAGPLDSRGGTSTQSGSAGATPTKCDPSKFPPLTDAQRTRIQALIQAFETANKADLAAVAAAEAQAAQAKKAGKSATEIEAILAPFKAALDRLATARKQLTQQIDAVLTAEQKASGCPWDVGSKPAGQPKQPAPPPPPPPTDPKKPTTPVAPQAPLPPSALLVGKLPANLGLTADQQTKIKSLVDAFVVVTKADVQALGAIGQQAADAAKAGKTKAEIQTILDKGAPIRARLDAAAHTLDTQILALLTADQRAWIAAHLPKPCDTACPPKPKTP